jgi:SpoIID/LytB domain protein
MVQWAWVPSPAMASPSSPSTRPRSATVVETPKPRRRRSRFVASATVLVVLASSLAAAATSPASAAPADFVFSGGGFGHGVGMSQFGAQGHALAGETAGQITGFYYEGTTLAPVTSAPTTLRILLGDAPRITLTPGAATSWQLDSGTPTAMAASIPLTVTAQGAGLTVNGVAMGSPTATITIPITQNAPMLVDVSGVRYRWGSSVTLRIPTPGTIRAVLNDVPVQQYLYGIAEVPTSWQPEALKAQALAARTYAVNATIRRRASDPTRTWDLYATTQDQYYRGYDFESTSGWSRWQAAVDATNGQFITSGGAPIEAYYSSSNGGYTENSEYAFASALSYLRAKVDPFDGAPGNSNFRWSRSFSAADLQARVLAATTTDVGPVTSISYRGPFGISGRIDRGTMVFTGPRGSATMSGTAVRNALNLPSTLLFQYSNSPAGAIDTIGPERSGGVRLSGWAFDPNASSPVVAHVYVDGVFNASVSASLPRSDIGAAFPGYGDAHGFDWTSAPLSEGTHSICVYALNVGAGENTLLGCRDVRITNQPGGAVDGVAIQPGGASTVYGWALDPNTNEPVPVHVYVDGKLANALNAADPRGDIAAAYPGYGPLHGFNIPVMLGAGDHSICTYVIDVGPGQNQLLGCRLVTVPTGNPVGVIDTIGGGPDGALALAGWAFDPDTTAPISVHVYVDGKFADATVADGARPDIAAAFPGYGAAHGYSFTLASTPGVHTVCVYGINVGAGANNQLACRTLTVPTGSPVGTIDVATVANGSLRVAGWAIDPDTAASIDVHVYADGRVVGGALAANPRADVASALPGYGEAHGFDLTVAAPASTQQVCIYGINLGAGANSLIRCVNAR